MAPNHSDTDREDARPRSSIKEVLEYIAYMASALTISIVFWWCTGNAVHDFVTTIKHDLSFLAYP